MRWKDSLAELIRLLDEADESREARSDRFPVGGDEPDVRLVVSVEPLPRAPRPSYPYDHVALHRLPRCYEWTVVPGPDTIQ